MKTKICGITRVEDALYASECGAWAIGFNFYRGSPRYIEFEEAKAISAQVPKSTLKVGILIGIPEQDIPKYLEFLDLIQVYQILTPSFTEKKRVILALQAPSLEGLPDVQTLQDYGHILLDAPKKKDELLGGTGRPANWDLARELARNHKLILAGGLNKDNVEQAIHHVQPFAVDTASGVETAPGIKSNTEMKEFLVRSMYVS